jgi:hypothetical protein
MKVLECIKDIAEGKPIKINRSLIKDENVFVSILQYNKSVIKIDKDWKEINIKNFKSRYKEFIKRGGIIYRNSIEEQLRIEIKYDLRKDKPVIRYSDKHNWLYYTLCGNRELKLEIENLLKATSEGHFYDFIINELGSDWSPFVRNLDVLREHISEDELFQLKTNHSLLDEGYKKRIIKLVVMRWLNDEYAYYSGIDSVDNAVFHAMMKVFPILTSIIFILKLNFGVNVFHSLITMVEAEFIFDVVKRCNTKTKSHKPFLVGTVHDAFVVNTDKAKHVLKHIEVASKKVLGIQCFVKSQSY